MPVDSGASGGGLPTRDRDEDIVDDRDFDSDRACDRACDCGHRFDLPRFLFLYASTPP
jgi:hypothetical protein